MRILTFALALHVCLSCGCGLLDPKWHSGDGLPLRHSAKQAVVYDGSLTISGEMNWLWAFTDYGIKVYKAVDDQGTALTFKSCQIFWMKVLCFEIEFSNPHPDAQNVEYDIAFTSRSGLDRLKGTLPIARGESSNYLMQLHRWGSRWRSRQGHNATKRSGE